MIRLATCFSFAIATSLHAADVNVPADHPTIQAAIDAANPGDTVIVADGTYTGAGNRELAFNGKSLTLRSANGASACIIDCESAGRGFYLAGEDPATIEIAGFTITRGLVDASSVGGRKGGGLLCFESSPTVRDCIFDRNHAHTGGGIFVSGNSQPTFLNCRITNHVFIGDGWVDDIHIGAGVLVRTDSIATFINCTIANNITEVGNDHLGGGVNSNRNAVVNLINCILWGNEATEGNQIGIRLGGTVNVSYCDVAGGTGDIAIVDGDGTLNWGAGNIDADPLFDAEFRPGAGSPAIDAGDNTGVPAGTTTDLGGAPRFVDDPHPDTGNGAAPIVDLGTFERQGDSTPCPGDLDESGDVGFSDLVDLLAAWGPCAGCSADLDADRDVDFDDLVQLLALWGPCP